MASTIDTHLAARLYPDQHEIRVESIAVPKIEHPDDAIVKIKLSGLCGSDLHGYRGHEPIGSVITTGHEFVGDVIALGSSFHPGSSSSGRPALYSMLQVGDKVVSPFTSSCGECHYCRIGFTARCTLQLLFGSEKLPGGQAQYVRVPKAGGTLFKIPTTPQTSPNATDWTSLSDPSLLLLADILPTGCFAALQTLQHPKILPMVTGRSYGAELMNMFTVDESVRPSVGEGLLSSDDRFLNLAIVGLGPVGICATVSLLDLLSSQHLSFNLVAIDPNPSRRKKLESIYSILPSDARGNGEFVVADIDEGKKIAHRWTSGVGCNAVLEVVGNTSALTLSYDLIRPFGLITSVGVHQSPQLPYTGRQMYDKNVSLTFGRCPVRTIFPFALDLLRKRQDVFGTVGDETSLIENVVPLSEAPEMYRLFEKGDIGKIVFDPWV